MIIQDAQSNSSTSDSQSDQAFLLSIYRLAVDYYQPMIERRTGVNLGAIGVFEYSLMRQHVIDDYKRSFGFLRSIIYRRRIGRHCGHLEKSWRDRRRTPLACYYNSAIYLSFSSPSNHEDLIAEVVVHELAHALWDKLGGPSYRDRAGFTREERDRHRILSEGFAMFAQCVWFADLYPLDARAPVGYSTGPYGSVYARGLRSVLRLVNTHGKEIVMELPRRWKELSNTD